jgi:uncharacterized protein YeeX (DUF496 family)
MKEKDVRINLCNQKAVLLLDNLSAYVDDPSGSLWLVEDIESGVQIPIQSYDLSDRSLNEMEVLAWMVR